MLIIKVGMFQTLALAVIAIYVGKFIREQFPILKNTVFQPLLLAAHFLRYSQRFSTLLNYFRYNLITKPLILSFTIFSLLQWDSQQVPHY